MTSNFKTERTRLRRAHERGHYDEKTVYSILDAMPVCNIAFTDSFGTPAIIPTIQWREGNHVYWHASSAARSLKAMKGAQIALSVTMLDGFVMARSAMHHSVNFRSVVIYGEAYQVDNNLKEEKLRNMIEALYPGRWDKLRPINAIELKQTTVFGMEINEASAKIRTGGVNDDEEDMNWPVWAGVVPVAMSIGDLEADPHLPASTPVGEDVTSIKIG